MRRFERGKVLVVLLFLISSVIAARGDDEAPNNKVLKAKQAAAVRKFRELDARKKAAAAAAGPRVKLVNADVIMLDNGIAMPREQAREQITKLFKVELAYVRRVCELTPKQTEEVAAAAVGSIDSVMKHFGRNNRRRARRAAPVVGGQALTGDVRSLVVAEVGKIVREHLQSKQVTRYAVELAKRDEHFRRSTVQLFVARIDEKLCLTAEQRQELFQTLLDDWRDQYGMTVEILLQNHEYVPQVSSGPLMEILDDYQKKIWPTLRKLGPQRHGAFGMGGNAQLADDFDLPGEEPAAEPQPQPGQAEAFAR